MPILLHENDTSVSDDDQAASVTSTELENYLEDMRNDIKEMRNFMDLELREAIKNEIKEIRDQMDLGLMEAIKNEIKEIRDHMDLGLREAIESEMKVRNCLNDAVLSIKKNFRGLKADFHVLIFMLCIGMFIILMMLSNINTDLGTVHKISIETTDFIFKVRQVLAGVL
ncbi:hypothetical protein TWF192_005741 [Orbilia oligospora]|uniref:Uncharacterized protein n=1 Tax=Orbilia oligospora TaxID=2813651 RepID=A0A6G1MLZ3_ORBOL|nr:hypothetical protein TWF191_003898 [Orbilia oligospora]KAF3263460.1 hypothetical protein TWF192_005741 [Orbilia oligospora]